MKKVFGIIGGIAGVIVLVFAIVLAKQCATMNEFTKGFQADINDDTDRDSSDENDTDKEADSDREEETVSETDEERFAEARAKWERDIDRTLMPPEDELDYISDSDYEYLDLVKKCFVRDVKAYDAILGGTCPTLEDVEKICAANTEIPQKFKDFIVAYAKDWLALYPETDFRPFCQNLKTLRIIETTADEIMMASAAVDAVAVYLRSENLIYVQEGTDFTKGTDGYIVLTHELTHAARSTNFVNESGDTVQTSFSETYDFGMYIEEAMLMRCAYALQGYEVPNRFYVRVSNYYRMILDCIDYDGADFMNHGINYLAKVLDDYMGEEGFGRKVIMIQCAEAALHYESYRDIPFTEADFDEMHADMVRIYMKKYLISEMSLAEAETVFQNFMELMMMNFRPDETQLEESDFRPAFENCCKELGIVE